MKRNALCIGFYELLDGLAETLELERVVLPAASSLECAVQLTHAAKELRSAESREIDYNIAPSKY